MTREHRVEQFTIDHPLWPDYVAHLTRVNMLRWGVGPDQKPLKDVYYLGIESTGPGAAVVGHLSLKRQPILVPVLDEGDVTETTPFGPVSEEPVLETFVQTFAVDVDFRRKGYGRALQLAALELTKTLGCYQMRSWSSSGHRENYALKLSLGFGVHPATIETPTSGTVSGVYFVKVV